MGQPALLCGKPVPAGRRNLALRIISRFPNAAVFSTRRSWLMARGQLGSGTERAIGELARPAAARAQRRHRRGRDR